MCQYFHSSGNVKFLFLFYKVYNLHLNYSLKILSLIWLVFCIYSTWVYRWTHPWKVKFTEQGIGPSNDINDVTIDMGHLEDAELLSNTRVNTKSSHQNNHYNKSRRYSYNRSNRNNRYNHNNKGEIQKIKYNKGFTNKCRLHPQGNH